VQHLNEVSKHRRDAAAGTSCGDRANVNPLGEGFVVGRRKTNSVSEQGAAGQRGGRVNGEEGDGFTFRGVGPEQVIDEARLADARRARDGNGAPGWPVCFEKV
jgi:hypothetical protein